MKLVDVIKYEGDNDTIVWKHDCEDFNSGTSLIVHASQEAIFFADGKDLDLFGAGQHILKTKNLPLLSKLQRIPTDGVTPFHSEVYFINKVALPPIKWGTPSQIEYIEPYDGFPLKIGLSGTMTIEVGDSRKLLRKIVGTEPVLNREQFVEYVKGILTQIVKQYVAQTMRECKIRIFEIDERLNDFSKALLTKLHPEFTEYGIDLKQFSIFNIAKPEDDANYKRYRDIFFEEKIGLREARLRQAQELIQKETDARGKVIDAGANAEKRKIEGYTYQQERGYDVADKLAQNEGVGNFTNAGIGLGMMAGVGGGMGAAVTGIVSDVMSPFYNDTKKSGASDLNNDSFPPLITLADEPSQESSYNTHIDAEPKTDNSENTEFKKMIDKLVIMKEAGAISEEKYQKKIDEILNGL